MHLTAIPKALSNLITWTHTPDPEKFEGLLSVLTDSDLLFGLTHLKTEPAGRICWAEYGRRLGFVSFEIRTVVMDGKLNVTFEGEAEPVHHGAGFQVKS